MAPTNRPYFRPNGNVTRGQTSKIVAIAEGADSSGPAADIELCARTHILAVD